MGTHNNFMKVALFLLLGIVLLIVGGMLWFHFYVRSEAFLRLLSDETSYALGVEGAYEPLQWDGSSAYSHTFVGRGGPDSPITEIRAEGIRAQMQLPGLLRWYWRTESIEIERVRVRLTGLPEARQQPTVLRAGFSAPANDLGFDRAVVKELIIEWSIPGEAQGGLRGTELELLTEENRWIDFAATGGTILHGGYGPFTLNDLTGRYDVERAIAVIKRARITDGARANLSLYGNAGPFIDDAALLQLDAEFEGIAIAPWLDPDWRKRVSGTLRGGAQVRGPLSDSYYIVASGWAEVDDGRLESLPILEQISVFTGSERFRRIPLHTLRADFSWASGRLEVSDAIAESEALMKVEGDCAVERGLIDGRFDLGLSDEGLRWVPGGRRQVFTTPRANYYWTKVRVTGPVDRPQEDLSDRLISAAGDELMETAKEKLGEGVDAALDFFKSVLE